MDKDHAIDTQLRMLTEGYSTSYRSLSNLVTGVRNQMTQAVQCRTLDFAQFDRNTLVSA